MTRFGVNKEEVEIDGEVYKIPPLSGKHLPLFYQVAKTFSDVDKEEDNEEAIIKRMDKPTVEALHGLIFESLKKEYPEQDEENLDSFATQNMSFFLEAVLKANSPE
jgi:hypothetical protein